MAERRTSYDFSNARQGVHQQAYNEGVSVRQVPASSRSAAAKNSTADKRRADGQPTKAETARKAVAPNLVLIEPEIFRVFESPEAINQALRVLIQAGKGSVRRTRKKAG